MFSGVCWPRAEWRQKTLLLRGSKSGLLSMKKSSLVLGLISCTSSFLLSIAPPEMAVPAYCRGFLELKNPLLTRRFIIYIWNDERNYKICINRVSEFGMNTGMIWQIKSSVRAGYSGFFLLFLLGMQPLGGDLGLRWQWVSSSLGGEMEWCYSWKWLSMLCGDPLTERTDRGSYQVTWPARWMCMRGKKRKGGTICSTDPRALPLCPPSFPHSLSLKHTLSPSLTPSLPPSSPQWRPWEESRYDASWRHKRNDMLALYSSPLVGF